MVARITGALGLCGLGAVQVALLNADYSIRLTSEYTLFSGIPGATEIALDHHARGMVADGVSAYAVLDDGRVIGESRGGRFIAYPSGEVTRWQEPVAWQSALAFAGGLAIPELRRPSRFEDPDFWVAQGVLCGVFVLCGVATWWLVRRSRSRIAPEMPATGE